MTLAKVVIGRKPNYMVRCLQAGHSESLPRLKRANAWICRVLDPVRSTGEVEDALRLGLES